MTHSIVSNGERHEFASLEEAYSFIRVDDEKHCGPESEKWRKYWETLLARFRQIS